MAVAPLVACIHDTFYKTATEALTTAYRLLPALLANPAHVAAVWSAVLARLQAADSDHEVRTAAIKATGHFLASGVLAGDAHAAAVALPVLLQRLQNETTRIAAAGALAVVAASPAHLDLTPIVADAVTVWAFVLFYFIFN